MSDANESQKIIECPHCGKVISATLEKCPYCQKEINQQPEQSQEDNKPKKSNVKKILLIAYAVLSVFIIFGLYNSLSASKTKNSNLQKKIESYKDNIDYYESANKDLKNQLAEKEDYESKYNELNEQIKNYQDQQSTIDSLNGQIADLQNQNNSLQQQLTSLQSENDSLKASAANSSSSGGAGGRLPNTTSDTSTSTEETVYWVSSGDCYHSTPNCATLKRSSNIMSGSVSSAGGRRPCKVCH